MAPGVGAEGRVWACPAARSPVLRGRPIPRAVSCPALATASQTLTPGGPTGMIWDTPLISVAPFALYRKVFPGFGDHVVATVVRLLVREKGSSGSGPKAAC